LSREAFRNLKGDLAIRPIFHQDEARIEAHIFIAFLAYCLHVTLGRRLHALAPGSTPRSAIEKFAAVQMKELTRRDHRFCRYADDANIYVRSRRAGERVMTSVSRFLTSKLRLKVNETKSAVAQPEERKFLGFSISNDGSERRIAPKALVKFKAQIRDMTRRTRGISLPRLIEDLAPYLLGWRGYFGFCQTPRALTNLEAWIRRRIRSYLWRQWRNGHNRFQELRRRGVPKFHAAVAAGSPTGFWRMSGHPAVQQALRNPFFDGLGLPRLYVSAQA
jgi:RNA-directed DNA polymerase